MLTCLSATVLLCWSVRKERDTGAAEVQGAEVEGAEVEGAEVEGAEGAPVCWPHATLGASDTSDTCCGIYIYIHTRTHIIYTYKHICIYAVNVYMR